MTECNHQTLVLLPDTRQKLQCRHCHLTIMADELGDGYCPECYEIDGWKRSDFESVVTSGTEKTRYRCEECHIIIEYED